MRIVIVGCGKIGLLLADQLSKEDHDVVVIDNNRLVLEEVSGQLDVMTLAGNGASLAIQREAGVGESDLLIAATPLDELNLLCCMLARKLGCKHTISRIRNPDYFQQISFLRHDLGLSMTINPDMAASREIYRNVQFPSFLRRDSFAKGRVELVELILEKGNVLIGQKLQQVSEIVKIKAIVCVVERGDEVIIPKGDFVFKEGDRINVTAARNDLAALIKNLKITAQKIRSVLIIGGSRIAVYLADELMAGGVKVKIIERSEERCRELSDRLPGAIIINGDGTMPDLLISEGIEETDAVITLTNIDEENLIASMYADHMGVKKTITKVNRTEFHTIFNDKGVGSVVSPRELSSNEILRYVRAMQNKTGGSVVALHRIVDGKAEALEFTAAANTKNLGVPLSKLPIKKNIILACINRNDHIIFPRGGDTIEEGDTVIVVTTSDKTIFELGDIFVEEVERSVPEESDE